MNELSTLLGVMATDRVSSSPQHRDEQDQVQNFILQRLPKSGQPLAAAAAHHFENPGKMLRAKMVMRGAYLLNVDSNAAV
jgi:geranylgeranyl pyrophosphate synthase